MFQCQFCKEITQPGMVCKKIVVASQMFQHPARPKAMKRWVVKNGRKKLEYINDPGGIGPQIVREAGACPRCAAKWEHEQKERLGIVAAKPAPLPLLKPVPSTISPEPIYNKYRGRGDERRPPFRRRPPARKEQQ